MRNLTGSTSSVAAEPSETVGFIRRSVQDQWGSTCILRLHLRARALQHSPDGVVHIFLQALRCLRIYMSQGTACLQGTALKDKTPLSELNLRPGEFLVCQLRPCMLCDGISCTPHRPHLATSQVALETKKARQAGARMAVGQSEGAAATSSAAVSAPEVSAPVSLLDEPRNQQKAQGSAIEPCQQSSPANSPWSSPYRTPQGVSPADTPLIASAGHTTVVPSPVSSENTFTLLPGYVSRPGPSPLKKPRRPSPPRNPGAQHTSNIQCLLIVDLDM